MIPTLSGGLEVQLCLNNTICGYTGQFLIDTKDVSQCAIGCSTHVLFGEVTQYFFIDTYGCYCFLDSTNCQPLKGAASYALNGQQCGVITASPTVVPTVAPQVNLTLCRSNAQCGSNNLYVGKFASATLCAQTCVNKGSPYSEYINYISSGSSNLQACYCITPADAVPSDCWIYNGMEFYAINEASCMIPTPLPTIAPTRAPSAPTIAPSATSVTLCLSNRQCSTDYHYTGNFATAEACGASCAAYGNGDGQYFNYIVSGPSNVEACYCVATSTVVLSSCWIYNGMNFYAINGNCTATASPSLAITAAPSLTSTSIAPSVKSDVPTVSPTNALVSSLTPTTIPTLVSSVAPSVRSLVPSVSPTNVAVDIPSFSPTMIPTLSGGLEVQLCLNNTICGYTGQFLIDTKDVSQCAIGCSTHVLFGEVTQYFFIDTYGCYCFLDSTNCQPLKGAASYALNGQQCGVITASPTVVPTVAPQVNLTLCRSNAQCGSNNLYVGKFASATLCAQTCVNKGSPYSEYINYISSGSSNLQACYCITPADAVPSDCWIYNGMEFYAINEASCMIPTPLPTIAPTRAPSAPTIAPSATSVTLCLSNRQCSTDYHYTGNFATAEACGASCAAYGNGDGQYFNYIVSGPSNVEACYCVATSTVVLSSCWIYNGMNFYAINGNCTATASPSLAITAAPSLTSTSIAPSSATPTVSPSTHPSVSPTRSPTASPTVSPTVVQSPTAAPSAPPSVAPTAALNTTLCLAETHCQIFFSPEGSFPTPASCALGCSTQYSYPWNQYFNFGSSVSCQCISSATSCTTGVTGSGVYAIVSNGAVCPAPASSPTLAPTIQVTPSIIAEAKTLLNFNGITDASQLTSTDIATIQAAIATVLGVSVTNVEILSIVNAALARRRGRRQLKGSARSFTLTTNGKQGLSVQSSGLNVDVNSQVIYNLVDYPNYNVTTLKKQIAEAITNTSSNGALQNAIVALAKANNLTVLMEVQVLESEVTGITSNSPSSSSSNSKSNGLSSGEIAIVVIIPIVGLMILTFFLYHCISNFRLSKTLSVDDADGEINQDFNAPQNEKGGTKSLYSNPQSTHTAELGKLHVDKVKEEVYL